MGPAVEQFPTVAPSVQADPARILVVDDDRSLASLLHLLLSSEGHDVAMVHDGREALESIRRDPPDLVLTDLDMPGVDGHELCRRLREDPATRLLPIVMITGRHSQEAKLRAWE